MTHFPAFPHCAVQTSGGRFTFSTAIDWSPQMLTTDRQGRATFGFGIWKSVYLLPLPAATGVGITQVVPHTFYAGGHPTTLLSDANHAGFDVNVTVDLFAPAAVYVTFWPAFHHFGCFALGGRGHA